jgi:hypothetical protein
LFAVFGFAADFVSLVFQQRADEIANGGVIVYDEESGHAILLLGRPQPSIQGFL